ncbi:MAG TPA: SDR family oxidoreductase [Mariniphaga sp.]|nr:SDR family oxidoreductase [Mariniphaga sp.]
MKKKVIITGGAQGIGKVISLRLIKEGYNVVVFEIDEEAIHEFKTQHPSSGIEFYTCDVSNELEVQNAIRQVTLQSGSLYALINNAAILNNKPIDTLTVEEWNRVLNVNLTGSFICAKYAVSYLKKGKGVIINLCSTRAFQSEADTEAYSASKGGVFSLTHALAVSLGPQVRVNSISPGWIDVSAVRKKSEAKQYQITEDDRNQHPAGRVGKADDIANMVIYLLNPENSFITGQNFIIDGGMSKKMIYV